MNGLVNLFDIVTETYSITMKIVNTVCFVFLMICIAYFAIVLVIGRLDFFLKRYSIMALLLVVLCLILHFIIASTTGIYILVPPVDVPFFAEFMEYCQLFICIGLVALVLIAAASLTLKVFDRYAGRMAVGCITSFLLLILLHRYIYTEFGVLLIQVPTLDVWGEFLFWVQWGVTLCVSCLVGLAALAYFVDKGTMRTCLMSLVVILIIAFTLNDFGIRILSEDVMSFFGGFFR